MGIYLRGRRGGVSVPWLLAPAVLAVYAIYWVSVITVWIFAITIEWSFKLVAWVIRHRHEILFTAGYAVGAIWYRIRPERYKGRHFAGGEIRGRRFDDSHRRRLN